MLHSVPIFQPTPSYPIILYPIISQEEENSPRGIYKIGSLSGTTPGVNSDLASDARSAAAKSLRSGPQGVNLTVVDEIFG